MSADFTGGSLPAAKRNGARGQACIYAEVVKQPVISEAKHIAAVPIARLLQTARLEGHIAQREGFEFRRHFIANELQRRCERLDFGDRKDVVRGDWRRGSYFWRRRRCLG